MLKIFIIFLVSFLASCAPSVESPVIYFSNSSLRPIKDIECNWADQSNLTLPLLNPGDSRSQSFYIHDNSDFFGKVIISWRNNKGEKITREFEFQKNHLPSIDDSTTYNYLQFFLDQEEMEILSSDAPDLSGKTRKMERLLAQIKHVYAEDNGVESVSPLQTSLIRVQHIDPQKDRSVPYWENSNSL
jgi:hypothetical protein